MYKPFYILLFLLTLVITGSEAQNLVPNPSFEQNTGCPQSSSELNLCNDWYAPTLGTSDYFHACAPTNLAGNVNVPNNAEGYQYAFDRDAYMGVVAYFVDWDTNYLNDYNEYIQCQLLQPLTAGKKYQIIFYVSLADSLSNRAIKSIGAWFSDTAYIDMWSYGTIPATPQVVADYFLADTVNWMEVSGTFTASGGEEYLTIGSFVNPVLNTDTVFVKDTNIIWSPYPAAYYYIDMVSVTEVVARPCGNSGLLAPNVFTPNDDGVNDEFLIAFECSNHTELSLSVLNRWGTAVFETTGTDTVSWDGGKQPEGTYYYLLSYRDEHEEKIIKKGLVQLLR